MTSLLRSIFLSGSVALVIACGAEPQDLAREETGRSSAALSVDSADLADQAEGLFRAQDLNSLVWQVDEEEPTVVDGSARPNALDVRTPGTRPNGTFQPVMSVGVVAADLDPLLFSMNHETLQFATAAYSCAQFGGKVTATAANGAKLTSKAGSECTIAVTKKYRTVAGTKDGALIGTVDAVVAEPTGKLHSLRAGFAVRASYELDDATVSGPPSEVETDAGTSSPDASTNPPKGGSNAGPGESGAAPPVTSTTTETSSSSSSSGSSSSCSSTGGPAGGGAWTLGLVVAAALVGSRRRRR